MALLMFIILYAEVEICRAQNHFPYDFIGVCFFRIKCNFPYFSRRTKHTSNGTL